MWRNPEHADAGVVRTPVLTAGAAVVGLAVVSGGFLLMKESGGENQQPTGANNKAALANACAELIFANDAADAQYDSRAFLPKPTDIFTNADTVKTYVIGDKGLFSREGPLGGNGDAASLAAMQSIVVDRALDGTPTVDPKYHYHDHFEDAMKRYSGPNGLEAAKEDCRKTYDLFNQIYQYNGHWADKGEQLTVFIPIRNDKNEIIDFTLDHFTAADVMKGTEYAHRESDKAVIVDGKPVEVTGFPSVLETADGRLFVKGLVPLESGKDKDGKPTPTPSPSPSPEKDPKDDDQTKGGSAGTTGTATGSAPGTQTGNNGGQQGCGTPGKEPCEGEPSGTGSGTAPGTAPGTKPGGGSSSTPSPSAPAPSSTAPSPTSTTTNPGTTTAVVTPPKSTPTACVPQPPHIIC